LNIQPDNNQIKFDYDKSFLIVDEVDVLLSKEILGQPHSYGIKLQDDLIYELLNHIYNNKNITKDEILKHNICIKLLDKYKDIKDIIINNINQMINDVKIYNDLENINKYKVNKNNKDKIEIGKLDKGNILYTSDNGYIKTFM